MITVEAKGTIESIKSIETKTGTPMTVARLKVKKKTKSGEFTSSWSIVAFREEAETLLHYQDGDGISLRGNLEKRSWEKDGKKEYEAQIIVNQSFKETSDDIPF